MLNALRFHNAIDQLQRAREAGYRDATMRGLTVRLKNPIRAEDRNHLLHVHGVHVDAPLRPRRIPNGPTESVQQKARELALEYLDQINIDQIVAVLHEALKEIVNEEEGETAAAKRRVIKLLPTMLKTWRANLVSALTGKFVMRAEAILRDRQDATHALIDVPTTDIKRLEANLEAFAVLQKKVADPNYQLTADERIKVARYTGWGGLGKMLKHHATIPNVMVLNSRYAEKYHTDLPVYGPLTVQPDQPSDEYYTPPELVKAIYETAAPIVSEAKNLTNKLIAFEPSAGIGRLVEPLIHDIQWTLIEEQPQQYNVLSALYPQAAIYNQKFERWASDKASELSGSYNLIMANPPYGSRDKVSKSLDGALRNETRLEHYFLLRCLPLLAKLGVAVFIIPHNFLDKTDEVAVARRRTMLDSWHLAAAVRLPNPTFGTRTVIDVLFCQGRGGAINAPSEDTYIIEGRYFSEHPTHVLGKAKMLQDRLLVEADPLIKLSDMAKLVTLRPITAMFSYNQPIDGEGGDEKKRTPSRSGDEKPSGATPTPTVRGGRKKPTTVEGADASPTATGDTFQSAQNRLVLSPTERHVYRACMLAEHIPDIFAMGTSGNALQYADGKSGYTELDTAFGFIVRWLEKTPAAVKLLLKLSNEGVEGAKLFLDNVWNQSDHKLRDYPAVPPVAARNSYLVVECDRLWPEGGPISLILDSLDLEHSPATIHSLVEDLCANKWSILPSFRNVEFLLGENESFDREGIHYQFFELYSERALKAGDLGLKYQQATTAKLVFEKIAYAAGLLAQYDLTFDVWQGQPIQIDRETSIRLEDGTVATVDWEELLAKLSEVERNRILLGARLARLWKEWMWLEPLAKIAHERICEAIGFGDVEPYIPAIETDAVYVAPNVLGDVISRMINARLQIETTAWNNGYVYDVLIWDGDGKDFAVTPYKAGEGPMEAYNWLQRYGTSTARNRYQEGFFRNTRPQKGLAYLRSTARGDFGEALDFDTTLGRASRADIDDWRSSIQWKDNPRLLIYWSEGSLPQKAPEGDRQQQIAHNCLFILAGNTRKQIVGNERTDKADNPEFWQRSEAISRSIEPLVGLSDEVRQWLTRDFVELQLSLKDKLKAYDEFRIEGDEEQAEEMLDEMAALWVKAGVPRHFMLKAEIQKQYGNKALFSDIIGSVETWQDIPVVPFEVQMEAEEDTYRKIVALDGVWICINEVGTPILGSPDTEFMRFIDAALQDCPFAPIRFAPDKAEVADYALQMRNELLDCYSDAENQRSLQHRLRALCAPYARRSMPLEAPYLMRWKSKFDAMRRDQGGIDPLPHQIEGAWQTFYDKGALMAYDVGVGKTYTATLTALQHRQYANATRVLMILPNPLVVKWCRDFNRCAPDYSVAILTETLLAVTDDAGQMQLQTRKSTVQERNQKMRDYQDGLYDVLIMPRSVVSSLRPTLLTHYACYARIAQEQENIVSPLQGKPWKEQEVAQAATYAAGFLWGIDKGSDVFAARIGWEMLRQRPSRKADGEVGGPSIYFDFMQEQQYEAEIANLDRELKAEGAHRRRSGKAGAKVGGEITEIDEDESETEVPEEDTKETPPPDEQVPFDKLSISYEDLQPDLVIIDEAQMFKNLWYPSQFKNKAPKFLGSPQTSAQSVALDALLAVTRLYKPCKVQLLSATPAKNSPIELYTALKYIDSGWIRSRGIDNVGMFADRFLRLGKTLYVKNTGELERDALAVTAFADVMALQRLLFRYATFLDSEQALRSMPEALRRSVKPKAIKVDVDVALSNVDVREVSALRGLIEEMGLQRQMARMDRLLDDLKEVAPKEKSSIMLALSVLPKIGAQSELSYVARPMKTRTLMYSPFEFAEKAVSSEWIHGPDENGGVPVVSIKEFYDTKYCIYPTAAEIRTNRQKTLDFYLDAETQAALLETQQFWVDAAIEQAGDESDDDESDQWTSAGQTILSVADQIHEQVVAAFERLVIKRKDLLFKKGGDHMMLPPKYWWYAATEAERTYMLRQIVRKQMKIRRVGKFTGLAAPLMLRPFIPNETDIPDGVVEIERFTAYPMVALDDKQWVVDQTKLEQTISGGYGYIPSESGQLPAIVDRYYGFSLVGSRESAVAAARMIDHLRLQQPNPFQPCQLVLYDQQPPDLAIGRQKRMLEAQSVRPWVANSDVKVVSARAERVKYTEAEKAAAARQRAAGTYYPPLPKANISSLKDAFINAFHGVRFGAQSKEEAGDDVWEVLKDINPSGRIAKVVEMVQQEKFAGKAQLIFCLEKDLQIMLYWALVQAGRDPYRIGIMNAGTTKTSADKLRFANMLNGVEGRPDTAELDIIIANSVAYEGIDLQVRTIAIHHFDLPWEPATLTQRNGRAWRQGNTNPEVYIYYYTSKDSSDSYRLQMLIGKGGWIQQIVESEAFVVANPSADPNEQREQQITALCPDKSAAELIYKKLEEVRRREELAIKQGTLGRLMLKLARLAVEIANIPFTKTESADSLLRQQANGRQELLGAKAEGLVQNISLADAVLKDEPIATPMIRRNARPEAMIIRIGDVCAYSNDQGTDCRLALRFLSHSTTKIEEVLWLKSTGEIATTFTKSNNWHNLHDVLRQTLPQLEFEEGTLTNAAQVHGMMTRAATDLPDSSESLVTTVQRVSPNFVNNIVTGAETCPLPNFAGWHRLKRDIERYAEGQGKPIEQEIFQFEKVSQYSMKEHAVGHLARYMSALGSDFPLIAPIWQRIQATLFQHVVAMAPQSRPIGMYEVLTLALSGIATSTLGAYITRLAEQMEPGDENATVEITIPASIASRLHSYFETESDSREDAAGAEEWVRALEPYADIPANAAEITVRATLQMLTVLHLDTGPEDVLRHLQYVFDQNEPVAQDKLKFAQDIAELRKRVKAASRSLAKKGDSQADEAAEYVKGLSDDVRALFTPQVQDAVRHLVRLNRGTLRLLCGKKGYWDDAQYAYFRDDERESERDTAIETLDKEMRQSSGPATAATAKLVISMLVQTVRKCLKSMNRDMINLVKLNSYSYGYTYSFRHELPVLFRQTPNSAPVIGIWYPYFAPLNDNHSTSNRCFNVVQIAPVDDKSTLEQLSKAFVVLHADELRSGVIEQHISIIPPDANGWAMFRTAKLGNSQLARFANNYFTDPISRVNVGYEPLRRSPQTMPNAYSP